MLEILIGCISSVSYIKPQLKETSKATAASCISSVSYIKPQLARQFVANVGSCISSVSYIKPQPVMVIDKMAYKLYIVRFLHQTTTTTAPCTIWLGCISSVSYIKPQPRASVPVVDNCCISSVSYIKPQLTIYKIFPEHVVYRPFPTSNHNELQYYSQADEVVYRPFPTSNHNGHSPLLRSIPLYIVRFLHQTTTYNN